MKLLKDMPQEYQFIDQVNQFMVLNGISATKLAKQSGIAASTLSQFLAMKYPGDRVAIAAKLQAVMEREAEKAKLKKTNPDFIENSISEQFFEIAKLTRLFCEIGVCYSNAGIGKTECAREFAALNADVILIETLPNTSLKRFLRTLHSMLYNDKQDSIDNLFDNCIERLKNSGRLIIIDEAENLNHRTLECVRRIYDFAKVGFLLCGLPRLLENIKGPFNKFEQLYSRSGIALKLEKLTEEDVHKFIQSMIPGAEGLTKIFYSESGGNTRRLCKIISRAVYIADLSDRPVDTKIIQQATKLVRVEVMS